jgi:hypothetical protein
MYASAAHEHANNKLKKENEKNARKEYSKIYAAELKRKPRGSHQSQLSKLSKKSRSSTSMH